MKNYNSHQKYFCTAPLRNIFVFLLIPIYATIASANTNQPLVKNGDFSQWNGNIPASWTLSKGANYQKDQIMSYSNQSLKISLIKSDAPLINSRVYQDIELTPFHNYRIQLMVVRHGTGTVAVRVQPIVNGRLLGVTGAPLNWSNWNRSFPWSPISLNFKTAKYTSYRVTVQNYGRVGESFWIDQIKIDDIDAKDTDNNESTFAYTQSIMQPFSNDIKPNSSQVTDHISAAGTRGNFTPVFLGLHAGRSLADVQIILKTPLTNSKGQTIPPSHISIRMVGEQSLLPPSRPRLVEPAHNLGWWITARIPETTPSGIYNGSIAVEASGQAIETITYQLRVEDFSLPQPNIPMFVYYSEHYFQPDPFLSDDLREAYYRDMKNHGMNTVTVYSTPDTNDGTIDFNHDYRYSALTKAELNEYQHKNNLTPEDFNVYKEHGLNQIMQLITKTGIVKKPFSVIWLPMKRNKYGWGDMPSEALQKSIALWRKNTDWPKPLLYVMDEPFGYPARIAAAQKALERIKKLNLPIKTTTAYLPPDELGSMYDIWIQPEYMITPEMTEAAKEHQKDLWVYNCNMPTENGQFTRAFYGFWGYRSRVKGIGLWAYYDSRKWWLDDAGEIHGNNGIAHLSRICPSPSGPIPTISWETTREGVTDYRYAMLFDELLKSVKDKAAELKNNAIKSLGQKRIEELSAADFQNSSNKDELTMAERNYLLASQFTDLANLAENARSKVINSIPYDAMAIKSDVRWTSDSAHFIPTIGYGDPLLASEYKRNTLASYIRLLSHALQSR